VHTCTAAARFLSSSVHSNLYQYLTTVDLVVEAIVENMAIKVPFYEDMGKVVKPSAIFASNTSSLPITQMAIASGRPDRFGRKAQPTSLRSLVHFFLNHCRKSCSSLLPAEQAFAEMIKSANAD